MRVRDKYMVHKDLYYVVSDMVNGNIAFNFLGSGVERTAYYIETGQYEGLVIKMSNDLADELGLEIDSFPEGDAQTNDEFHFFESLFEDLGDYELLCLSKVLNFPLFYDYDNGIQILEYAGWSDAIGGSTNPAFNGNLSNETRRVSGKIYHGPFSDLLDIIDLEFLAEETGKSLDYLVTASEIFEEKGVYFGDLHTDNVGIVDGYLKIIDAGM